MVRFAYDALLTMRDVTQKLESTLGPDTTGLSLRMGLHSGPVTAGVLRGGAYPASCFALEPTR